MERKDKIVKHCVTVIHSKSTSPRAQYLSDGQWIITSQNRQDFTVKCHNTSLSTSIQTTKTPIDIFTLKIGCSAINGYMTLPPFYHFESKYQLNNTLHSFLSKYYVGAIQLWKPIIKAFEPFGQLIIPNK